MITGYLTAKIGRLFLFSFGGVFLLAAVRLSYTFRKGVNEVVSSVSGVFTIAVAFVEADFTS
jgi:hypothetical protein